MEERIKSINPNVDTTVLKNLIASISDEKDVVEYCQIVTSGSFYKEFGELLKEKGELVGVSDVEIKKTVKEIVFATFFSQNSAIRYINAVKIFKYAFPNVYKVISLIKDGQHNTLAVVLQNLEAEIILHNVCKELDYSHPAVPLFTLHDAVITTVGNEKLIESKIQQNMKKFFSKEVSLQIERWE